MRTLILALLLTVSAFAFADNEIYIEQVGEGVEIIIEQTGNGNLIGQNTNTGANATDMKLQIGNSNAYWLFNGSNNLLFGDINSDGSNIDYNLVGSNNRINQLIGTVDGNTSSNYSADGANIDLLVDGSGASNTIGAFINSSNAIWDWDITGSNNWILTTQEDGSDNKISVDLTGDKNYVFVGQRTGTGLNSTEAILDASFVTDGSEITIIQQDTGE